MSRLKARVKSKRCSGIFSPLLQMLMWLGRISTITSFLEYLRALSNKFLMAIGYQWYSNFYSPKTFKSQRHQNDNAIFKT